MILALCAPTAHAQDEPGRRRLPLRLELTTCRSVPAPEVRRIVAIELRGRLATPDTPAARTTRAAVSCDDDVQITVDDPITGKRLLRSIALSESDGEVRARILALAIVELVSASWAELVANPEPQVEPTRVAPVEPAIVETATEVALEREDRTFQARGYVALRAAGAWFPTQKLWLFGPGLRVGVRLLEGFTVFAEARFDFGGRTLDFGDVRVERYGGAVGALYDVWGETFGGWVGGAFSGASVRLQGESETTAVETSTHVDAFLAVSVEGGFRWRVDWFFLALSAELGVPLLYPKGHSVDQGAAEQTGISPSPFWFGAAFGLGLSL
ncbi:MAG: hypothetical protein AAGF12_16785 [Myxococcota bacterium]